MSLRPSKPDPLEEALESTRRNVRKLEIDAYRIRADLTRLEVAYESTETNGDSVAPADVEVPDDPTPALSRFDDQVESPIASLVEQSAPVAAPRAAFEWQSASEPLPDGMDLLVGVPPEIAAPLPSEVLPQAAAAPSAVELPPAIEIGRQQPRVTYRKATSPVVASLTLHAAILIVGVSITVASIVHRERQFTTTVMELGDNPPKPLENLDLDELGTLDNAVLQNTNSEAPQFDVAGPLVDEVTAVDFESVDGPVAPGDMGALSSLPTDLGTVMMGTGGLGADGTGPASGLGSGNQPRGGGGKRNGGAVGSALFFGTKSKGDRFVFVVDNSSSMKNGRLESAIAEMVRTVEALSPKQMFYVIFVSDQTYPLFYPAPAPGMLPATPQNKKRLAEWLPKAIFASGNNRKLIEAMDMAAALQPQVVYLLWDGDMKYSEKVRQDVMTHLTQPNHWRFVIHTLGMGITSLDAQQNLTMIALAHGGTYQRVDVPAGRGR